MLMHKILQAHLLRAFVAKLKIDIIYALYPECFCDKNLAVRKVFAFSDSDDNDIFQEGIIQNSVGLRTLVRTGRPNMMTMMMEEDEGEDDYGDELTHPSKSACDLHQLTWGCGRPVFNEIIRNDPITHL